VAGQQQQKIQVGGKVSAFNQSQLFGEEGDSSIGKANQPTEKETKSQRKPSEE